MKRNLESRVEVVTPVQKPELQSVLRQILNVQLTNQRSVWEMQPDGQYIQLRPKDKQLGAQETLIKLANNRFAEVKTSKSHKKAKKKPGANRDTD
jgi:polyphosphate kinase